nr:DUF2478 domain-containing protein [Bradyrhizobium barranii]
MLAVDVATGQEISIYQSLGSGATSGNLNTTGLAEAAAVASRALCDKVDLLVISTFCQTRSRWPRPARQIHRGHHPRCATLDGRSKSMSC